MRLRRRGEEVWYYDLKRILKGEHYHFCSFSYIRFREREKTSWLVMIGGKKKPVDRGQMKGKIKERIKKKKNSQNSVNDTRGDVQCFVLYSSLLC